MSVPFYYQGGNLMSATLKQDMHRIRRAHEGRYKTRQTTEMHLGNTRRVTVPAAAEPVSPRVRHEMFVLGKEFFRD